MSSSRYEAWYPEDLIKWAMEHPGQGHLGFCKEIRISPATFSAWREKHEDFGHAADVAEAIHGAEYERLNLIAARGEGTGKYPPNGQSLRLGLKQLAGWNTSENGVVSGQISVVLEKDVDEL